MGRQQAGFTLIELVAVLVVLGILAATALPKFIDVSREARIGVLQGVSSAMRGAGVMVYAKSLAEGEEGGASETVTVAGVGSVSTVFGYPASSAIADLITLDSGSSITLTAAADGTVTIQANCLVTYTQPGGVNTQPDISITDTGC